MLRRPASIKPVKTEDRPTIGWQEKHARFMAAPLTEI
jgi:hypothetical protein